MGEVTRGVVLEVRGEVCELGDIRVSLRHRERERKDKTPRRVKRREISQVINPFLFPL